MQVALSILIPSIPSRFGRAMALYNKILDKVGDRNIEVLMFTDNKKRTIGEKRNALKNSANGKYFLFVDDDDDIDNIDLVYEAAQNNDVDVITYKSKCKNIDGSHFIVTFGLGNEVEHKCNEKGMYVDIKRPPWHNAAWANRYKQFDFAPVNYGEDWEFVKQCIAIAQTEYFIDEIVHYYNYDPNVTEADTSSNAVWKNPGKQ